VRPAMTRLFSWSLSVGLSAVLVACGGGSSPADPIPGGPAPAPNPGPGTDASKCAFTVSNDVTVPTTAVNTASACDYLIQGTLSVTSLLTIEPGTVLRFTQDSELVIGPGGVLNAVGTPTARIRMEGVNKTKGYWDGISFNGARPSRIEYTDIESAGQTGYYKNYAAVSGVDGTLSFKHNTVSGSYATGMSINKENYLFIKEFSNNVFYDNLGYGLRVSAQQTTILDAASDYLGTSKGLPNGAPYVKIDWDDVYGSTTIHKLNAPYYVSIALYYKGGLLTIEPGVKIVMDSGATFNMHGGALKAVGTATDPIIFTGEKAQNGYWDGLDFFYSGSSSNRMEHVQVLYGGAGKGANVYVGNGSYLNISNSRLGFSDTYGLCLDSIELGNSVASVDIGPGMVYESNPGGNVNLNCG
jgi:Right handed beta helix region